jgi:hypothetical protein
MNHIWEFSILRIYKKNTIIIIIKNKTIIFLN